MWTVWVIIMLEVGVNSREVNVLLVDDEPQIRNLLERVLMKAGSYHVLTASSGEDALDLSRNQTDNIDILVTDIDMGKMSGIELYRHIREERPETMVLFISGKGKFFRNSLPEGPLLEKPFSLREFMAKVVELRSTAQVL